MSRDATGKLELRKEKKGRPPARGRGLTKEDQKEPGYHTSKRDVDWHCKGGKHLTGYDRKKRTREWPCKRTPTGKTDKGSRPSNLGGMLTSVMEIQQ